MTPHGKRLCLVIPIGLIESTMLTQGRRQTQRLAGDLRLEDSTHSCWFWRCRKCPWDNELRQLPKAGSHKEMNSPLKYLESSVPGTHISISAKWYSCRGSDFQGWRINPVVLSQWLVWTATELAQCSPKVLGNFSSTVPKYHLLHSIPHLLTNLKYFITFLF